MTTKQRRPLPPDDVPPDDAPAPEDMAGAPPDEPPDLAQDYRAPPDMLGGAPDLLPEGGAGADPAMTQAILAHLAQLGEQAKQGKQAAEGLGQIAAVGDAAKAILSQIAAPETLDMAGGPAGGGAPEEGGY